MNNCLVTKLKETVNIIDESNPITVMLFIKDGLKKISESNQNYTKKDDIILHRWFYV